MIGLISLCELELMTCKALNKGSGSCSNTVIVILFNNLPDQKASRNWSDPETEFHRALGSLF